MHLLVIGGSVFLGRHLVNAALAAGHRVTTFNRGTYELDEQKNIERLIGDRNGNLDLLKNRRWDAVIDTCGYEPDTVSRTAQLLAEQVESYIYISSISAYADFRSSGNNEAAPLALYDGIEWTYGSRKAACEKVVQEHFSSRSTIIRPGLIVGPYDPTDRFTYWVDRVSRGGNVLAPGRLDRQVQFVDARDLSSWIVQLLTGGTVGNVYNATGPDYVLSMEQFLSACISTIGSKANLIWTDDQFLIDAGLQEWKEVPLWNPDSNQGARGFLSIDCSKAIAAGLSFRPLSNTIADTLAWSSTRDLKTERCAGIAADREQAVLSSLLAIS